MKTLIVKAVMEDGSVREFEYDMNPENLLELIPRIISDFSDLIGSSKEELLMFSEIGLDLAKQSIH